MPPRWTRHTPVVSTILSAFELIASRENLVPGTQQYRNRRRQYVSSEVRRIFSAIFGVDVDSLEGWKSLCIYVLGTTGKNGVRLEELQTIEDCQKVRVSSFRSVFDDEAILTEESNTLSLQKLKNKFINLIDLVEFAERGETLPRRLVFHSKTGLSEYTRNTTQFFPKEDAKEVPLLKHFLITIEA
ncbi:hypothetical protein D9758_014349 [Tetrapyrgos nigripes]|uniref:LAGLIDADG homing endonuclease n=1 Tax=Tetrapyrgos nigripes TaxID=182062 RepID=A0A8H5C6V2_9AGAR|nr:hypothetical protein D9758_014349 [Tetrapyrgos nigripes]